MFPGCLRRWQPVHIAGGSSNRSLPSAGLGQTLRGGLKRGRATPEASSFCEALQHPARVLRIPFPGGRRGCWDPSASTLGAAGGAGPAVPVSSVMCLRTSSSGTNFTCRERLLRVSSGRLMAAPVTWARSRRRGALPPGGADRRRLTPHLTSPLTAPLLRDRGPARSPHLRQRRRQQEAEPGSRASQWRCRGPPRGSQPGRRALSDPCYGQPAPRSQPASAAERDFRRGHARSAGLVPGVAVATRSRRELRAGRARPRPLPLTQLPSRPGPPAPAPITLLRTSNSQSGVHFCSETARYLFNIFIYLYIYIIFFLHCRLCRVLYISIYNDLK